MIVYRSFTGLSLPPGDSCVALGLFDGLHLGHQAVIRSAVETAREQGMLSAVFTFSISESRPAAKPADGRLLSASAREQILSEMGLTYILCPPFAEFRGMTPEQYVRDVLHGLLRAKYIFCGENYHFGRGAAGTVADLRQIGGELGIQVRTLPMVQVGGQPVNSTRIRRLVAEGDMKTARELLGRPFSINFEVVPGRKLGRKIDSPTINQVLPDGFAIPRFGVYASVTTVDGKRYASVSNVGVKPTVGSDRVLSETCILKYEGDLYGRHILVEYLEFIRPEIKFASIDALREQIQRDAAVSLGIAGPYVEAC